MTVPGTTSLYFYNCTRSPPGVESCLNTMSSNLDTSRNPRVCDVPGINIPMFYVGDTDSITAMHVEDGLSDSVNVLHAGNDKLWIVIVKSDYTRLNKEVSAVMKAEETVDLCDFSIHHKNIVLTPALPDSHEIRYKFVTQRAGDMLYVGHDVPHQVVNVGLNVAEAVNVGSADWNIGNSLHAFCNCHDAVQPLQENVHVNHVVRTSKLKRIHSCETDSCKKTFPTKALL